MKKVDTILLELFCSATALTSFCSESVVCCIRIPGSCRQDEELKTVLALEILFKVCPPLKQRLSRLVVGELARWREFDMRSCHVDQAKGYSLGHYGQ